jgi:hypothetical protein
MFHCRCVRPKGAPWRSVEAASPEEAAHEYFATDYVYRQFGAHFIHETTDGREDIYFGRVEVAEHGSWIVRVYRSGIYRRGGVRSRETIRDIAQAIDWTEDPNELLVSGWLLEETEWR